MNSSTRVSNTNQWTAYPLKLAASIMILLLLAGCGGTKVYNNDKTIVYRGTIYNVSNVKQISSKSTGRFSDDTTVNLISADRKQFESYVKENGPIYVRQSFDLDGQEMLYQATTVKKGSQYQKMQRNFEKAGKQIMSLLSDKKKMQLEL